MKIIVFSDSHGRINNMQKAINIHKNADCLLHAGDGILDINLLQNTPPLIYRTKGNYEDCSYVTKGEDTQEIFELFGKKIFLCHGHRHNVNFSMSRLIYSAVECDSDIAIFGHTHVKHNEYISGDNLPFTREKGLYIFNPGSISTPRDDVYGSFGIIEIQEKGVLLSHGIIK